MIRSTVLLAAAIFIGVACGRHIELPEDNDFEVFADVREHNHVNVIYYFD